MTKRFEVMTVNQNDTVAVYVVKRAKLAHPDAAKQREFLCLHCEVFGALPWFEIKQAGFIADHYQLVCYCNSCLQLSIYEFEVGADHETD